MSFFLFESETPSPIYIPSESVEEISFLRYDLSTNECTDSFLLTNTEQIEGFCAKWNNEWVTEIMPYQTTMFHSNGSTENFYTLDFAVGEGTDLFVTFQFADETAVEYAVFSDYIWRTRNSSTVSSSREYSAFYFHPDRTLCEMIHACLDAAKILEEDMK